MTTSLTFPCPHCGGMNRVPHERIQEHPRCGHCQNTLITGQPTDLTQANFARQIRGDLPLLVDVWAAWCGPRQQFAPTFQQAAERLKGICRLAKLDSEAESALAGELRIRSIPTLILFNNGQEAARLSGALPLAQLLDWLSQHGVRP